MITDHFKPDYSGKFGKFHKGMYILAVPLIIGFAYLKSVPLFILFLCSQVLHDAVIFYEKVKLHGKSVRIQILLFMVKLSFLGLFAWFVFTYFF